MTDSSLSTALMWGTVRSPKRLTWSRWILWISLCFLLFWLDQYLSCHVVWWLTFLMNICHVSLFSNSLFSYSFDLIKVNICHVALFSLFDLSFGGWPSLWIFVRSLCFPSHLTWSRSIFVKSCCKSTAAVFARYPGTNYIFMEQNAPDDVNLKNIVVITVDVAERSKRSNFIIHLSVIWCWYAAWTKTKQNSSHLGFQTFKMQKNSL